MMGELLTGFARVKLRDLKDEIHTLKAKERRVTHKLVTASRRAGVATLYLRLDAITNRISRAEAMVHRYTDMVRG